MCCAGFVASDLPVIAIIGRIFQPSGKPQNNYYDDDDDDDDDYYNNNKTRLITKLSILNGAVVITRPYKS